MQKGKTHMDAEVEKIMIPLISKETGEKLGEISVKDLDFLIMQYIKERRSDQEEMH